jgi:hypothetical protein
MDSPALAPFEDAQEFSSAVLDAEPPTVPNPAPPNSISQTASPAPEDYYTAPSTPGLSTGGDPSPRNSLLITPTYTRTLSGLRDCVVDVDTETSTSPMEVLMPDVGAMPVYQAPKENLQLSTTPPTGLVPAREFVPATTPTAESPVKVSPTNTATSKHGSRLSMSSLRASAPTFAPAFAPASLRAAAPAFVPGQGCVPVAEPAAPPQPAPQPAPAPSCAKVAAPVVPTWAKIAATKPKMAEVQPVAAKAPKEVDSVADKETPEPKLSEPEAEKEQEEVEGVHEVEAENSATPTATEEPQGEKADEGIPQTVVKEEDSAETELETPTFESVDEDASPPAVSAHEEKLPGIEEDFVEQNGVADGLPVEEVQAAAIDIVDEVEIQKDKIEETHIEQDDVEQECLLEELGGSDCISTEEIVKRPEQPVEKISGLTNVFVWASPSENNPADEQVSGLKHVFVWAGSDAPRIPESQTPIVSTEDLKADKDSTVPEAESAEEEPVLSEDGALDNTQTEAEQQPEIQRSCAAPEDKKAELNYEQDGEESEEKAEDVAISKPEIAEDKSAVQLETKTQVAATPTAEEQADETVEAVKDAKCEEGIQAESGSDLENLEPDVSEDAPTQAPLISVQDFAPSAPSDDVVPPKDTPAPAPTTSNDSLTPTVTQLDTFNPTFLVPSPAVSARSSVSSFAGWSTYGGRTMTDHSRGSVDTIRVSSDMPTHSEPKSSHSRPQTAGYLGLGHGGADMGLRGALGDSRRRLSLPLKNLFVGAGQKHGHDEVGPKSQETTAVGTPESSIAGDDTGTPSKPKKRRLGEEGDEQKDGEVKCQEKEDAGLILAEEAGPSVLLRMMMLLAGVVAVGKALKKPSVY